MVYKAPTADSLLCFKSWDRESDSLAPDQIGFNLKYIYVQDKWTLSVCKNIKVYHNLYSLNVQDKWTLSHRSHLKLVFKVCWILI